MSYVKNSGDGTLDVNTGVVTWDKNENDSDRTTEVAVTVTFKGVSGSSISYSKQEAHGEDGQVGEIAYWTGSKIDYIPYSAWTSTLGTPIGVCVIPKSHHGKARYISVKGVTSAGTASDTEVRMGWGPSGDTSLTNYTVVPTWDNTIGGTVGTNRYGYLSSDKTTYTGATNVIDTKTKYYYMGPYVPSPYMTDGSFNVAYNVGALSDMDGKSNTAIIASLGSAYTAFYACSKYKTSGTNAGNWYLPSAGELVYIMSRYEVINAALSKVSGVLLLSGDLYWSSTEYAYDSEEVYNVGTYNGTIGNTRKAQTRHVRPFIQFS